MDLSKTDHVKGVIKHNMLWYFSSHLGHKSRLCHWWGVSNTNEEILSGNNPYNILHNLLKLLYCCWLKLETWWSIKHLWAGIELSLWAFTSFITLVFDHSPVLQKKKKSDGKYTEASLTLSFIRYFLSNTVQYSPKGAGSAFSDQPNINPLAVTRIDWLHGWME